MQRIGGVLATSGALSMILGMLFFDKDLLAPGNIIFLEGLLLIIGPQETLYFFARKNKLGGTICFFGGILLIFLKWPAIGVMVEMFGSLNLFGDFFPVIVTFLRQLSFVGQFLNLRFIRPSTMRTEVVPPQWAATRHPQEKKTEELHTFPR